jgi:hypothetical protein
MGISAAIRWDRVFAFRTLLKREKGETTMKHTTSAAAAALKEAPAASVHTTLGLIGGEILLSLETCGPVPARDLIDKLEWPSELVYMAVGALIRRRMIGAAFRGDEVVVHLFKRDEPRTPSVD